MTIGIDPIQDSWWPISTISDCWLNRTV